MILSQALSSSATSKPPQKLERIDDPGGNIYADQTQTKAKKTISPETSKRIATVYRCSAGISDDIASMPLQHISRAGGVTHQVAPDAVTRNIAYLLEIRPNRWMTPFVMKKLAMNWTMFWGNGLIWMPPPPNERELFVLPTNCTTPWLDRDANTWFEVRLPSSEKKYIPKVEVMHIMINSTNGQWGRSIWEYARETMGLRAGMSDSQSALLANGLNPAAYIQVEALLDSKERKKYKDDYSQAISGADNAGNLAVFDKKVSKFETISMNPRDAEMLESMGATDRDIANFFKYPEFKLNMGKQSYESNDAQELDYLKSCLDPYAVQWEQAARLAWLSEKEQPDEYFRFVRSAILRTDPKKRAEIHEIEIRSGTLNPNEAREHEDRNGYAGGEKYWMTSNNAPVDRPEATTANTSQPDDLPA